MRIKEIIKSNGVKYPVRSNRRRIFTPDEWSKLYGVLKENSKPVFLCLINTGARINEVLHIKKEDIDFKNKNILIKKVKRRNNFSDGRIRNIKISTQYRDELEKYCKNIEDNDYLFKITKQAVSQMFKRNVRKAGLDEKEFSLHNIRKTTECWLNFLGNNHLLILMHMGHNQSTAVDHYLTTDIYDSLYKFKARQILGDLYM